MWSRTQSLLFLVPVFLVLVPERARALSRDDLYTHGQGLDTQLPLDDDSSSEEVQLSVPIVFYGQQYTSLFVSTFLNSL